PRGGDAPAAVAAARLAVDHSDALRTARAARQGDGSDETGQESVWQVGSAIYAVAEQSFQSDGEVTGTIRAVIRRSATGALSEEMVPASGSHGQVLAITDLDGDGNPELI